MRTLGQYLNGTTWMLSIAGGGHAVMAMNLLVDHEYSVMNTEAVYWVIAQSLSLE